MLTIHVDTIAGLDEAGRGPLAGPVVAAAVILRQGQVISGVRDSKQMTSDARASAALRIRGEAVDWALGQASRDEIDRLNILQASLLAMQRAFLALRQPPARVEIDGNRLPVLPGYAGMVEAVVEGDRLRHAIAAASVLAKVHRDGLMQDLHATYPQYGFDRHKGYPTAEHRAALARFGPCPEHRHSFAPVRMASRGFRPSAGVGPT